jgi:hypothetical protein
MTVLLFAATAAPLEAQLLRGKALSRVRERPIDGARIVAQSLNGVIVGEAVTNEMGAFRLAITANGAPFVITITRIGLKPLRSGTLELTPRDTIDVDFDIDEESIVIDTVQVRAAQSLNEVRLREAERRGWKLFTPKEVEQIRNRVQSFEDLLRSTGFPGFIVSPRRDECIRSTRNYKCLAIAVDGIILSGSYPLINPRDVYFLALLSPNQAVLQFGDRAPNGAVVVTTRGRGDRYDR